MRYYPLTLVYSVHSNSGINNHAYALLVDGGTYNDQTITGIGIIKAAHIFWRSQNNYLTKSSGHDVQADALEAAANDLLGTNLEGISTTVTPAGPSGEIITSADITQLKRAIDAVEMRMVPGCTFFPLLSPSSPTCPNSIATSAIYYESFESGLAGWIPTQHPVNAGTWESRDWVIESNLIDDRPGTGVFATNPVNGNCTTSLQNGTLRLESPSINIPGGTTGSLQLSFDHWIATESLWDGANIKYSVNGGAWTILPGAAFALNPYNGSINTAGAGNDNPQAGEPAFTGTDGGFVTGSWSISTINLAAIGAGVGDNFKVRFELGSDGCNGSSFGWYVDNVRVYVCDDCEATLVLDNTWNTEEILYEAATDITTTDDILGSAHIAYSAGQKIDMPIGFEVSNGAQIEAFIDGCTLPGSAASQKEETRK